MSDVSADAKTFVTGADRTAASRKIALRNTLATLPVLILLSIGFHLMTEGRFPR